MNDGGQSKAKVLIVGGGVAGLETALAIRDLCGKVATVAMLTPEETFTYRPLAVAEPFGLMPTYELELGEFGRDAEVTIHRGTLERVELRERSVVDSTTETHPFDYLVVATGAVVGDPLPGATAFAGPEGVGEFKALLARLERGEIERLVFAGAPPPSWLLPLYELALMTAAFARNRDLSVELIVVTEEPGPLAAFGGGARADVARLLADAGIEVRTKTTARRFEDGALQLASGGGIEADAVVAIPRLRGPGIAGLPADDAGFIPIDDYGHIDGRGSDFAVGDATSFPVKHGGIAAQQADAAAGKIAQALGQPSDGRPFRAELDGSLLTGDGVHQLHTALDTGGFGGGRQQIRGEWTPLAKVSARYLGAYLAAREEGEPG